MVAKKPRFDFRVIAVVIVVLICSGLIMHAIKSSNRDIDGANTEGFIDGAAASLVPSTYMDYGVFTFDEAKSILAGAWDETFRDVGPSDFVSNLNLYYSAFSHSSRSKLASIPYTWQNVSPNFVQNLPVGCKLDDSKIVMTSNPLQAQEAAVPDDIYTYGVPLSVNNIGVKGTGPKGMNLGVNTNGVNAQSFTLFTLVKFNDNATQQSDIALFKSWANTNVNVGLVLAVDCYPDNNTRTYPVNFKVTLVDQTTIVSPINVDKSKYYLVTCTYKTSLGSVAGGYEANVSIYEMSPDDNTKTMLTLSDNVVKYKDSLDFTNKPVEIGDVDKASNPVSLMTFGIYNKALDGDHQISLATYFLNLLRKTSKKALIVYRTGLAMTACPLGDDTACAQCDGVNWGDITSILNSSTQCKANYNDFCVANPTHSICGCYAPGMTNDPSCKSWRDLVQGLPMCTSLDYEKYKNENNLCPCSDVSNVGGGGSQGDDRLSSAVVDFYKAEAMYLEEQKEKQQREPTFWQWLLRI